jgi:hypothetical protein
MVTCCTFFSPKSFLSRSKRELHVSLRKVSRNSEFQTPHRHLHSDIRLNHRFILFKKPFFFFFFSRLVTWKANPQLSLPSSLCFIIQSLHYCLLDLNETLFTKNSSSFLTTKVLETIMDQYDLFETSNYSPITLLPPTAAR